MRKILLAICISLTGWIELPAQTYLDTAINFVATDVYGNDHDLYEYLDQGKFVMLDFFYTTCAPCIGSIPDLNWAMENYGCNQEDLIMLSIDWEDNNQEVLQYQSDYGALSPAISGIEGGGNQIISDYGVFAFPTVILIAPDRQIINQDIFPVNQSNLQTAIEFQAGISSSAPCSTTTSIYGKQKEIAAFDVFPNPAFAECNFKLSAELSGADWYEVRNSAGQLFLQGNCTSDNQLDVSGLPNGLYQINLYEQGQIVGSNRLVVSN
ncbi:MAG: redoxin domain-containing protein [Bacteroidetes bacterium]|nr:redoxin domain-containing protein [Bacteroidota bacterium]